MTLRSASTNLGGAVQPAPGVTTAGGSDGVTYSLQQFNFGGNSHQSQIIGQTTAGVAQAAVTITSAFDQSVG